MEIGFLLSETFIVNAERDGDEMKLVMKEFTRKESIEIKQRYWREFAASLRGIDQAIEKVKNGETVHFCKPFVNNFYVTVTSAASVVLVSSDEKFRLLTVTGKN